MSSYSVVIEGSALPGFVADEVRPRLAALVKRSEEVAAKLLAGHPTTVKSGVDHGTGMRYVQALTGIGVACRLKPESADSDLALPKIVAPQAPAPQPPALQSSEPPAPEPSSKKSTVEQLQLVDWPAAPSAAAAAPQPVEDTPASRTATSGTYNAEEFYKAIIGPKNQDYYLRQFSRFDGNRNAGGSWNWPAFFVTFYWFLYRKMWVPALIYFFLPYLVMMPIGVIGGLAGKSVGPAIVGISYFLYLAGVLLLPPIYANAWYYKHCKKKIAETRASSRDAQRQLGELSARGGTSAVALVFVLVLALIAGIGILAAIAIPAYQDFTVRARMAEATAVGTKAAESVANYYYQHQEPPGTLAAAGFVAQLPPSIKEIGVNGKNGVVTVTMAARPIEGKTLLLVPSLDANMRINWKCLSHEIQDKYLPRDCRQQN